MADSFALVHSPLVGPSTWAATASCVRRDGHRVVVPSLAGVVAGGPPYYARLADTAAAAIAEVGGPCVLVGHSGAGPLLPAIAEALGDDVRAAVFVDALLPHPGRSWFDTAPAELRERLSGLAHAGWLPPWHEWFPPGTVDALLPDATVRESFFAEIPTLPLAYFEEVAPDAPSWHTVRCGYLRLSAAYDERANEAEQRGWWVHREDADHLAMLTQPDVIADVLARAATAVG
ncbi:MAG: alpha/beta fold hydrolase [Actinophytocola sp.]|nr:alpha/beta fold hydrolase [Actinophytocola sp.]